MYKFSFSDISWDVRSQISQGDVRYVQSRAQYDPRAYQPHQPHPHQPPTRVLDQINQLKKTLQEEYVRIQYNLEHGTRAKSRSGSGRYPHPEYSLPPRGASGRRDEQPKAVTQAEIRKTTDKYLKDTESNTLTVDELKGRA